jgi:hypothetical protein
VAKRALVADPVKAHQDMLRLVSRMSIPENIPPGKAAFSITTKPREADIIQPYKKGSYTGGPKPGPSGAKRQRMDKDKDNQSESGKDTHITNSTLLTTDKYKENRVDLTDILKYLPDYANTEYITAAFAKSTWNRIKAALKCAEKFAIHTNTPITWPMSDKFIHTFTTWALNTKDLSHSTVEAYIQDFSLLHKLRNIDNTSCKSFLITTTLKGAKNLDLYDNVDFKGKATISLSLLRNIGYQIYKDDMTKLDKQVFWSALTLAFWGSLRMGELLSNKTTEINVETFTWKDIDFKDDSCLLHIKFPKVSKKGGDLIEIFKVDGLKCCPVRAVKQLRQISNYTDTNTSPFVLSNGKNLTPTLFTTQLKKWAKPYEKSEFIDRLTGHCCRGAIPSMLASRPDLIDEDDIMIWGRWTSESYKIYAKKSRLTRKIIFDKITRIIESSKRR